MTTLFGSATPCKRAARFGVSPTIACSLRSARSDQVPNDHQTRCDTDPRLQGCVRLEATYRRDQLQARSHCSLCVIFMGLRVSKIHQHPVTHVLRDKAADAPRSQRRTSDRRQ